ncbi:MAG TPA: PIN domain-containing protein [Bacillota bacterium]|jgi:predicted nucleic acid-binding protein|nr:PIN domain-containing protein [Bacillota bacterium]HOL09481.1 PIN domain-containing protein [Bacillota bacterium]HPO97557.1 PIN domain-containing protein [Bacillota bacterium]
MQRSLIDAGPLIALFDKDDRYHSTIKQFLKGYEGRLYSSWPVVTEVLHMLDFNVCTQLDFLRWLERGGVTIKSLSKDDIPRIIELSEKYSDVPMNFADASLIIISETENIKEIISIDSDFYIYRNIRNEYLKNILNI